MRYKYYAFKLAGICTIVFILQILIAGFSELFLLSQQASWEIWRYVTAIFLHGSLIHLLYNMFALLLFGSVVEGIIGSKRFLVVFFATGILANLISVNFYSSSLGASGAIFGVIGALVILRPMMTVWAFNLPMPMFVAGILWAAGDLIGVFVPSGIANIAHLSGMGFGLILGLLFRERHFTRIIEKVHIPEHYVRRWEDAYMRQ